MAHRVTMADVAREAEVSLMTISRVINNKEGVSPATRQQVWAVIDRLGYRPSGIARGLATRRTGTLGLVVPDVANPFFAGVAQGVEHVAYAQGYHVFLCNTEEDPQRELAVLQSLDEKRVDGVILCSSRLGEKALQTCLTRHPAVVLVNRRLRDTAGNPLRAVLIDDLTGGRLVTHHLLAGGHRAIGLLAGPTTSHSGQQRLGGYQQVLAGAGIQPDPAWQVSCVAKVEGGQRAALALLQAQPQLTALFCYNDLVAVGALQACAQLGRRVPQDLAVVGFDDIPLAALVTPPLTTCRVARSELGIRAVRLLLDQIVGGSADCDEALLRPELVVRASAP